jgi:beta-mannosidase
MAAARNVSVYREAALEGGWEVAALDPGIASDPTQLEAQAAKWLPGVVPGTAASALRAAGQWDFSSPKRNFDAVDWWYRCRFDVEEGVQPGEAIVLKLGGLATVCDVWLNGQHVLRSDNMFHEHAIDVTSLVREKNELTLRFHALAALLQARRPRPRWKTKLIDHQQLRWFRTTLLGRIPGWTPPANAVGPWRAVSLERRSLLALEDVDLRASVDEASGGKDGVVRVSLRVRGLAGHAVQSATLHVGEAHAPLTFHDAGASKDADGVWSASGEARVRGVELWWPHTHGAQPLYGVRVSLKVGGSPVDMHLGRVGFRTLSLDTTDDGFALSVNGVPVFCRGACWTTTDVVSLGGGRHAYAQAVGLARAGGMNMLRVGGTMVYESDAFYEECDAQGILVWQDFMFANMDYPGGDEAFLASVQREASQFLSRTQASPCLAILCGSSEIEQQTAMLGLPRAAWTQPLFQTVLPAIGQRYRPDLAYWPSSPSGGTLPFQVSSGAAHYYGVGAYLRPLEDARRASVRFASECLAFANVPEDRTIEMIMGDGESPFHHPAWKARAPRDAGPGWDFEDVRDHYLKLLYEVDPVSVRYADMERYLALSRVTSGEVMASAIGEWRRRASTCRGALVWFYRDLWPGAGWGVVDSTGAPKAAYYYLKRAYQPVALFLSDEGLNGLELHALNDTAAPIDAEVRLTLYRHGAVKVAEGATNVVVPPRSGIEVRADSLFEHFLDTTYAFRFGPPGHDVAVASLTERGTGGAPALVPPGRILGQAFHFPLGLGSFGSRARAGAAGAGDPGIDVSASKQAEKQRDGEYVMIIRSKTFAQSVAIDARDYLPDDNYFHIEPGGERTVVMRPIREGVKPLQGTVQPLNAVSPSKIVVRESSERGGMS